MQPGGDVRWPRVKDSLLLGAVAFVWTLLPQRIAEMHFVVLVLNFVHCTLQCFAVAILMIVCEWFRGHGVDKLKQQ